MAELQYTPEQAAAIHDRGGDLLVSAAAGSGKTRVLVQRLMEQVEAGADLTDFLIITYTRAAAAELRGRILEELGRRTAQTPSRHLRRQTALLYQADIGTIHAFCSGLIREYAHVLERRPDFRTADEGESRLLVRQTLEDLLEDRYSRIDAHPGFAMLADTVSTGRDDTLLERTVLETYEKLRSHPYPEQWAAERLRELDVSGIPDAGRTPWGSYLMEQAAEKTRYWLQEMTSARRALEADEKLERAYGPSWDETLDGLDHLIQALETGWDAVSACGALPFPRPKPVPGHDALKDLRRRCKTGMDKVTADFALPSKALLADLKAVTPAVTALVQLVLDLDRRYGAEKIRRGLCDFSDLEHLAVRLLVHRETGGPTAVALELGDRYREVMVDEYQDVSGIQDILFGALGAGGARRFSVGDVKQSIYRFRLADPTIFLRDYRRFQDLEDAAEGAPRKVLLGKNFRSHPGILDAVNFVFRRIMSVSFGEMEYGDRESLSPGLSPDETGGEPPVELTVLDLHGLPKDESDSREMAEARAVALRIRELHDSAGYDWGAFAILLRSVKGKAHRYEKALEELDIPVTKSGGESFFHRGEVAAVLSLLTVIVNPLQDVPLISVLRSPLFAFSPDALAEIRQRSPAAPFYEALTLAADDDARCAAFLEKLAQYRDTAPDMPADQFLWYLYNDTGALTRFGAMDRGESRKANLLALLDYARKAESGGYQGLFSLVTLLEKQMEAGDLPALSPPAQGAQAVSILSIHKSKGLEYPVVLLPDLSKKFNLQDGTRQILVHPELGIGSIRRDLDRKIYYSTLPRTAISKKLRQESLWEELRVLYVAMTRAQERLLLFTALDDAEKTLGELTAKTGDPVSPYVLESASNMGEWILLPALLRPESAALGGPGAISDTFPFPWHIRRVDCTSNNHESTQFSTNSDAFHIPEPTQISPQSSELRRHLQFEYPYPDGAQLPGKLTATALKGRVLDREAEADAAPQAASTPPTLFRRPAFVQAARAYSGAERGTAAHLVMQYIDFSRCTGLGDIQNEIARLVREARISAADADAVDAGTIWKFFDSDLGKRVRRAPKLRREFKFSLLVPASRLFDTTEESPILFQGVVDCYLEEAGTLTVIDFKTDYVPLGGLSDKAEAYRKQVEAYAWALSRMTGLPVREVVLYFFGPGEAVVLSPCAK